MPSSETQFASASQGSCPLCASPHVGHKRWGIWRCDECGLGFLPDVWSDGASDDLEEEWFDGEVAPLPFWPCLFSKHNANRVYRNIRSQLAPESSVLEVGFGHGNLLAKFNSEGFRVEGCDLSAALCRNLKRTHGIEAHHCPVSEIPEGRRYDLVLALHVLEHTVDPIGFLRDLASRLRPGGLLYMAVPNSASWEARLGGWTSYEPYHMLYLTPRTLRRSFEQAGLGVSRLWTHESFSGWFLALLRTAIGHRGPGKRQATGASTASKDSLVRQVYYTAMAATGALTFPLRYLQRTLGYGDEIVALAHIQK